MPRIDDRRAERLIRRDRVPIERCLGESFGGVRLVPDSHFGAAQHGQIGSSQGEEVHLAPGLPEGLRRAVLAHELAHVVQRRNAARGAPGASDAALEAEADAAALAAISGRRFACTLGDDDGRPRAWAEAGHYYTVQFVLLAAGMEPDAAAQVAFYAQMPDQVAEFDAMRRGYDVAGTAFGGPIAWLTGRRAIASDIQIDRGLHCLTGGGSEAETARRRAILMRAGTALEFGLGLHAFGDSYAHRTLNHLEMLYLAPVGHAFDGTTPDHIDHRPALYQRYGLDLYDVIGAKFRGLTPRLDRAAIAAHLKTFSAISSDKGEGSQIFEIRRSALGDLTPAGSGTIIMMNGYKPETEGTSGWSTFKDRDAGWSREGLGPQTLLDTLAFARRWSVPGTMS